MSALDEVLTRCYHVFEREPRAVSEDTEYCACANQIKQLHANLNPNPSPL
jgi:hypothetical protein